MNSQEFSQIARRAVSEETRRRAAFEGFRDSSSAAKDTLGRETLRLYEFGPFRLDPTERKLMRTR